MDAAIKGKLLDNIAIAILVGKTQIVMDDATDCGKVYVDPKHIGNGQQNALGSVLPALYRQGVLAKTDRSVQGKAPQRRGGAQKVWLTTDKSMAWAVARVKERNL